MLLEKLGPSSMPACSANSNHVYFRTNSSTGPLLHHLTTEKDGWLVNLVSVASGDFQSPWSLQSFDQMTSLSAGATTVCFAMGTSGDQVDGTYLFMPMRNGSLRYLQGMFDSDGAKQCLLPSNERMLFVTAADTLMVYNHHRTLASSLSPVSSLPTNTTAAKSTQVQQRSVLSNPQVVMVAVTGGAVIIVCLLFFAYKWRQLAWKANMTNYVSLVQQLDPDEDMYSQTVSHSWRRIHADTSC
jgi:hypothetical protein